VPAPIKKNLTFHFAEHVQDVLDLALLPAAAASEPAPLREVAEPRRRRA
jgi:hypothetical protein